MVVLKFSTRKLSSDQPLLICGDTHGGGELEVWGLRQGGVIRCVVL
jgi:hypothetical protein